MRCEAGSRELQQRRGSTSEMNVFDPERHLDRIVSVEMFEHMMNWRELLMRVKSWLAADGRFLMHIFTHRSGSSLFDRSDADDWIAQHFFTGGGVPSPHFFPPNFLFV